MPVERVCLIGGSGFIGRYVAEDLSDAGIAVVIPTRRREHARFLMVLPTVDIVETDVHDPAALQRAMQGCDAVIHLAAVLHPEKPGGFERSNVELARTVAQTCLAAGVPRLIHMSALNADPDGPSEYLKSRGRGEAAVRDVAAAAPHLHVTTFRPSVVFGRDDRFLNLFAALVRRIPVIPLGTPDAKFQPIHVDDVARAIVASLDNPATFGQVYALCGPRVYTLRQLVDFVTAVMRKSRTVIGLGPGLSMLQAAVFERLPGRLVTRDNVHSMRRASVCDCEFPAVFGFKPATMESIVPQYLQGAVPRGRYQLFRHRAGRKARANEDL